MPRICTVCAHLRRAEIDERLALQVVNVAQVARDYRLTRHSVARHRDQHLPQFLRAFAGEAAAVDASKIHAEAQRLYLTALDALARAEQGTSTHIDEDGTPHRRVSYTAIARFIREARQSLDLLAKLSATTAPPETPNALPNGELSARIAAQLDKIAAHTPRPQLEATAVDDAEVLTG
jgi:hypothetical protein